MEEESRNEASPRFLRVWDTWRRGLPGRHADSDNKTRGSLMPCRGLALTKMAEKIQGNDTNDRVWVRHGSEKQKPKASWSALVHVIVPRLRVLGPHRPGGLADGCMDRVTLAGEKRAGNQAGKIAVGVRLEKERSDMSGIVQDKSGGCGWDGEKELWMMQTCTTNLTAKRALSVFRGNLTCGRPGRALKRKQVFLYPSLPEYLGMEEDRLISQLSTQQASQAPS